MKYILESFIRILLFALIIFLWSWVFYQQLSNIMDISISVAGILLMFPISWIGRKILDKNPTPKRTNLITTVVHYILLTLGGGSVILAIKSHQGWSGWSVPIPTEIGFILVIITGVATLLTVINLALKGLGAPFAIALSRKLAVNWLYAWTRNPMVFTVLALGLSLGIWFQSILFMLWVLILFTPALLFFVKIYEERELELRFGESYKDYKSKTPMLFPRRPRF